MLSLKPFTVIPGVLSALRLKMGGVLPSKRTIFEGSLLLTVVTLAGMCFVELISQLSAYALSAIFSGAAAVPTRDPDQMWECRPAPSQSLSFCSMIDYQYNVSYISQNGSAVWDHQSGNDSFARSVYDSFIRQLSVYNCLEYNRYWTCDNCSDAYKVWLCAVLFPKCTDQTPNQVNVSEWKAQGPTGGPTCPPRCTLEQEIEANKTGAAATDCTMLTLPWHRCVPQTRTCRGMFLANH